MENQPYPQQQQWGMPQPQWDETGQSQQYEQPTTLYPGQQYYPPMPQPAYPPQTLPPQQPVYPPYQQGYPQQTPQGYPQPYGYAPPPINVSVNVQNSATANAAAGVVLVRRRRANRTLVRIAYFLWVGWWAGLIWAVLALCVCATIKWLDVGVRMLKQVPTVLFLKG